MTSDNAVRLRWANWVFVWGAAHQLGFFWTRIQAAPRRFAWLLLWGALFALIALTNMRLYPRSIVGVPGEKFSNLGPPTLVVAALTLFQIGVARIVRDRVLELTDSGLVRRGADWITANAQALYLGHAFAYGLVFVAVVQLHGDPITEATGGWWLWRPFWLAAPSAVFAVGFSAARLVRPRKRRPS